MIRKKLSTSRKEYACFHNYRRTNLAAQGDKQRAQIFFVDNTIYIK